MTEENARQFAALMTQASEIYKRDVSQSLIKTYFDLLSDYEIADIEKAFFKHFSDENFGMYFPLPAHIVKNAKAEIRNKHLRDETKNVLRLEKQRSTTENGRKHISEILSKLNQTRNRVKS